MTLSRGDVVLIDFPQPTGGSPKRRPALVVQSDRYNSRLNTSLFAEISSNISRAGSEPTHVLIDITTAEGQQSGLHNSSVVKCTNLTLFPQTSVVQTIGHLPDVLMQEVNEALKLAQDLG